MKISTEAAIECYVKNMGGVDRGDQHRALAGGFKRGVKVKKWYKAAICGLFDFGLVFNRKLH